MEKPLQGGNKGGGANVKVPDWFWSSSLDMLFITTRWPFRGLNRPGDAPPPESGGGASHHLVFSNLLH